MCFNTISSFFSNRAQASAANEAAAAQYKAQQEQQKMINIQVQKQFQETLSRNRLETARGMASTTQQAQAAILENQKRQATAVASASTAGITGTPLQNLFNDFQVAIGGVATNLQSNYQQLNENLFFNNTDAQLQAQSQVNQATPAKPYFTKSLPILPYLVAGVGEASNDILKLASGGLFNKKTQTPNQNAMSFNPSTNQNFFGPQANPNAPLGSTYFSGYNP
jgi:hypothetical protein